MLKPKKIIIKVNFVIYHYNLYFYKFPNNNIIMIYTMEKLNANCEYIKTRLGIVSEIENKNNSENRAYSKIYEQVKKK